MLCAVSRVAGGSKLYANSMLPASELSGLRLHRLRWNFKYFLAALIRDFCRIEDSLF